LVNIEANLQASGLEHLKNDSQKGEDFQQRRPLERVGKKNKSVLVHNERSGE